MTIRRNSKKATVRPVNPNKKSRPSWAVLFSPCCLLTNIFRLIVLFALFISPDCTIRLIYSVWLYFSPIKVISCLNFALLFSPYCLLPNIFLLIVLFALFISSDCTIRLIYFALFTFRLIFICLIAHRPFGVYSL